MKEYELGFSKFNLYFQEEPQSQRMPPFQMSYEATGLKKDGKYEFWVTASTNIGEGQPSKYVVLTPSDKGIFAFT